LAPDDAGYRVLHADIILELEQFPEAYIVYRTAIDSVPDPSASWLRMGAYSAFRSDDKDNALDLLIRAKLADPDDVWTAGMLADLWLEKSEFDKAAREFDRAMVGTDDDESLFSYRFGKAKADAGAGRHQAAFTQLTVLAKQQPNDMDVSWARANVLLALGRHEDALVEFEHFRRRRPDSLEVHHKLIDIMIETGRYEAALKLADRLIYMDRDKAVGFRARGRIYLAMDDFEAAGRNVDAAIRLDPDDARLQAIRAQIYLGQGAALPALQNASRAVELAPRSLSYRVLRARIYLARNDAGAALSELDEALALGVGEVQIAVEAHRLKAQAHEVLGQFADARAALEAAEDLEDGQPASRTAGLHEVRR
jgi:tetratricopeptide (TPR) repeat protein